MSKIPGDDSVSEFLADLNALYPDSVDVFEDELAIRLGLERHPDCTQDEWRVIRVRFINHATDNDPEAEALAEALIDEFCESEVLLG